MRYSAVQILANHNGSIFNVVPISVIPNTRVFATIDAVERKRKAGFEIVSEIDGMVHMVNLRGRQRQVNVLIPETSPLFNAFFLYSTAYLDRVNLSFVKNMMEDTFKEVVYGE